MIKVGAWQNCKTALLLRWLSTADDHVRPHAAPDNHRVVRSPLRDAGSAYRDRPNSFVAPAIASQNKRSAHFGNTPPAPKSP
jgi:hypothetical protein